MLRRFIDWNKWVSARVDDLLPARLRLDGNRTFKQDVLPDAVLYGDTVYELGGGSQPWLSPSAKHTLSARVIGLDIDGAELAAAVPGAYDEIIVHDLCTFKGHADADVVICQATLEHVPDTTGALNAIATILRPGGRAFIFAPCRNAAFARLNLLLPERIKRRLLFAIFPEKAKGHDGFKAYYNHCTPGQITALARQVGLDIEQQRLFWTSSYLRIFFPAFLLWRFSQLVSWLALGEDAAETFIFILRKPSGAA